VDTKRSVPHLTSLLAQAAGPNSSSSRGMPVWRGGFDHSGMHADRRDEQKYAATVRSDDEPHHDALDLALATALQGAEDEMSALHVATPGDADWPALGPAGFKTYPKHGRNSPAAHRSKAERKRWRNGGACAAPVSVTPARVRVLHCLSHLVACESPLSCVHA